MVDLFLTNVGHCWNKQGLGLKLQVTYAQDVWPADALMKYSLY